MRDSTLLFENNNADSVHYSNELWGCFRAAHVSVSYKRRSKQKAFLYSDSKFLFQNASLYLADHDRPLSVTGDTYIKGVVFLPKSGIRSGFFQHMGFSRKNLIEGTIDSSKRQLPPLRTIYRNYFQDLGNLTFKPIKPAGLADTRQSFSKDCKYIYMSREGIISNQKLSGKIIVFSDSVLEVRAGARLKDVLLVAPYIHFSGGFRGTVQAIALDSISIDQGCVLEYPSALVGIGRSNSIGSTGSTITIDSNSTLHGIALALSPSEKTNIRPVIKIKKGAEIKGMIYNEGYSYLNGMINGCIFTHFFFEQRGPMTMENILIDAQISPSKWFQGAALYSIFSESTHRKIIKWLY